MEADFAGPLFLRKLARRGLRGVKLVISDAHEGIKAAVSKLLCATWQRCRVHFMRNILAHAGKSGRRVVSAFIGTAFAQDTPEAASQQWAPSPTRCVPSPKLAALMDDAEPDVLAYMTFPKEHRAKCTAPIPSSASTARSSDAPMSWGSSRTRPPSPNFVGAILMEQSDEWAVQRARYMTLETMAPLSDNPIIMLSAVPGT